jgi:polyadenylation factor subunit 2
VQAHEDANRSMTWSRDEQNMITGDDLGTIKYWNPTMSNVGTIKNAHAASGQPRPPPLIHPSIVRRGSGL